MTIIVKITLSLPDETIDYGLNCIFKLSMVSRTNVEGVRNAWAFGIVKMILN